MNRKTAAEQASVIQAFAAGKDVQFLEEASNRWTDTENPSFSPMLKWRVKPEPREFFIALSDSGAPCGGHRAQTVMDHPGREVIRFREILS